MQRTAVKIFALLSILLAAGCASKNHGKVSRNPEVTGIFRSGIIPEGYSYYYSGEEKDPAAILGIKDNYTLQARFWTRVNLNQQQLEKWRTYFKESVGWVDNGSRERLEFQGYGLQDPQGNEVGILFSRYDWTVIEFPANNVVIVYPPQPRQRDPLLAPAQ